MFRHLTHRNQIQIRRQITLELGCAPASSMAGSACERCAYFKTGPENVPVLLRQRNHARAHGQTDREVLFESLVTRATQEFP